MELIKLSDIRDDREFWRGSKFRLINNGTNLHPDDKYFDYLLSTLPWDNENMILVNVTPNNHKEGAVYASKISVEKSLKKIVVRKQELKKALGKDFENFFLIESSTP